MLRLIYLKVFSGARTLDAWIVFAWVWRIKILDFLVLVSCGASVIFSILKKKYSLIYDYISLPFLLLSSWAAVLTVGILSPLTCTSITTLHLMLIHLIDPVKDNRCLIEQIGLWAWNIDFLLLLKFEFEFVALDKEPTAACCFSTHDFNVCACFILLNCWPWIKLPDFDHR